MRKREPLVVFADDWGRHPSSCQHLVRRMLPDRCVLWVNTIGTRRPGLRLEDWKRGLEKLGHWRQMESAHEGLSPIVLNPLMVPSFKSKASRWINKQILKRTINRAIEKHCDALPTVVTTLPLTADLVDELHVRRWVYYCVDDYAAWPGLDGPTLRKMEDELLEKVDGVAVASGVLADSMIQRGQSPTLITHGLDFNVWWGSSKENAHAVLSRISKIRGPRVMFWGLIDARMDVELIRELSAKVEGAICLVGPTQGNVEELAKIRNVHLVGAVPHRLLPRAAEMADALIMPYVKSEATRAMQPLKLMEYLATSKPVVCTDLPAVRPWADCCEVVSRDQFAERVQEALGRGLKAHQHSARERRLPHESWEAKAAMLETIIEETHLDETSFTAPHAA